jgi:hypothetical protein
MPSMKITLSAAMRARDASRPRAGHEAAARAADLTSQAAANPVSRQRPAAEGGTPPGSGGTGGKDAAARPGGHSQPAGGRQGGGQRAGRGRGRSRRRKG